MYFRDFDCEYRLHHSSTCRVRRSASALLARISLSSLALLMPIFFFSPALKAGIPTVSLAL